MKVLNLIIKQKFFDEIIKGTKKQEFRDVRPTTEQKYLQIKEGTDEYETDEDGYPSTIKYDAIRFYVGYNKNRDSALVEVVDSILQFFTDEKGNFPIYEKVIIDGEESDYPLCQVVYDLGKVLETNINHK